MKTLKFKDFKAKMILDGEKSASMRLFDEKNIQEGDELELINSDTQEKFAQAKVTKVVEKKISDINEADLEGHEKFESRDAMIQMFKKYYGDKVDFDTMVKIIHFKIL